MRSPLASASRLLLALILLPSASACSSDDAPSAPAPGRVEEIDSGGVTVRVDTGRAEITLARGDSVLLRFSADALELGSVPALDDTVNYDPYRLYVPSPLYAPLQDLTWLDVTSMDIAEVTATDLVVSLGYAGGKHASLRLHAAAIGRFEATLLPDAAGPPVAFFRLRPHAGAEEGFYGLGEYLDDVNHRGHVRAMQLELDTTQESGYNEAHVPVPFVIGTRGWGLFVESPYPGVFALGTERDDVVEAAFGTGLASEKGLTFHLFAAERPLDVTKLYYDVAGYPRLPARWALGPWVWRDENDSQAQVEGDLDAMRDLDLPTTGYWIDRPYATAVNTFDWNPAQFPDPAAMIAKMHALGFRTAIWHTPYLDEKDGAALTAELRAVADDEGYYPPDTGILFNKWGKPVDLTNPDAYAWWQGLVKSYTAMGVEGMKLDYAEDVVVGLASTREPWAFFDGSDERTMHAQFQLFYHRLYAETLPADGGLLLCRAGTYGDQANGVIVWPGDLDASFARHGEKIDDYTSVGGLAPSMIAGLNLGPSGFPFYGADTGGYRHSPPDRELFTRWFEQTALSSVMQIGNSASTVAWEPSTETGYDEEMLGWYREYTRLHLRLFPYEWTYATNLARDGRPLQRPIGLAYPEMGVHPADEYLFGDALLVAPVLDRGVTERSVVLPPGKWADWWTGEVHEGGQTITVDAPLDRLPLFLAEGGVVPMLRPTIDTLSPTTEPDRVDSYATSPGVLYARVLAGPTSTFTLFDGGELTAASDGASLDLASKSGAELASGALFEAISAGGEPPSVTIDGSPAEKFDSLAALEAATSGYAWSAALGGTLYVKLEAGAHAAKAALHP